jgi:Tol biopolymer transport system component
MLAPAAAQATLVYVRNPNKPVVWIAQNNGSQAHKLAQGSTPRVTPNGSVVVYENAPTSGGNYTPKLMVTPAAGGSSRTLATGWRNPFVFAFSPDSSTIATVLGPEIGSEQLVLINLETGVQRTVAKGYFSAVSFSPDGTQIVYGRSASERYPQSSDIYQASVSGGAPVAITHDHHSLSPLWGPNGKIAFVKQLEAKQRLYGPKNELYLMSESGGSVKRLTHTKVAPLLQGLTPTQWSANGTRLLAEFGGEDTSYAVTVNPSSGAQHRPGSGQIGLGFVGDALSADGSTILGSTGGFEPGPGHNVVTVPYGGGKPTVLARNAYEPDWNR